MATEESVKRPSFGQNKLGLCHQRSEPPPSPGWLGTWGWGVNRAKRGRWRAGTPWHCSKDTPCSSSQLVAGQRPETQASVAAASPRDGSHCLVLQLTVFDGCSVAGLGARTRWLMQKQAYEQITRQPMMAIKGLCICVWGGDCAPGQCWSSNTCGRSERAKQSFLKKVTLT